MKAGIANSVLVEQVRNTAAWLWSTPGAEALTAIFDAAADEDATDLARTLRLRLSAHYATVATFVPTDVDAHIRHHMWMAIDDASVFAAARAHVDEAAARDASLVSARVTLGLSGHDGEWFSVRAGALGRALVLGFEDEAAGLAAHIDAELDREERLFAQAIAEGAPARTALALATIVAHNLGDLSRVVEAWPKALAGHPLRERYSRLAHTDAPRHSDSFVLAGALNKELMAHENHRFLALRKPRALRRGRELLLPVGPWFDAWGSLVARTPLLDDAERAEVVAALIELHLGSPRQEGCLRALAGIHQGTRGGLASFLAGLPARIRKEALRGRIRDAIDVRPEVFEARFEKRFRSRVAPRSADRWPRSGTGS
ncbi:MAG TPA: hypothetical protein VFO94_03490 [Gammaproteobacteria bacterium]|nr:hypothetical protein [Gammaproteobacteria bacterium]